jgi:hypothetical protein
MGMCSWYTCRNDSSNMGRMRFPLSTAFRRRLIQFCIIVFKRYHLRFISPLLSRGIRPHASGSQWLPRYSPYHHHLQCYMPLRPYPSNATSDMGPYAYPRLPRIHPNRLRLESTLGTASVGICVFLVWSGHLCRLLGLSNCVQENHGRIQQVAVRIGFLARGWILDWSRECPDLWAITDKSIGL